MIDLVFLHVRFSSGGDLNTSAAGLQGAWAGWNPGDVGCMRAAMTGRGGSKLARKWKRDRERKLFTERALWGAGFALVAGVDEVGMGPLAGPVVAAGPVPMAFLAFTVKP